MIDHLIINGLVFDGAGGPPVESNIGMAGDRIVHVGPDRVDAENIIDARGLIVCPGFIDTHAHSEFTILADGRAEGKLSQGITTEINGNCGLSAAPLYGEAFERREADLKELGIKERWHTFDEYFDILGKKGISINFATLCGHGNIRASVMGYKDKAADENALPEMKRLLSEAARQGARGLSTGLIYPPGIYSDTEELVELCKAFRGHPHPAPPPSRGRENLEGIYTSHMRSEGDGLIEAIEEIIRIGKEAGVNIHISHLKTAGERNWRKIDKAIELIEGARAGGLGLTCDRYPYVAASTDLDTVLPSWVYDGGTDEELRRLNNPGTRKKIRDEISSKGEGYWKGVYVSSVARPENEWMTGENIADIAAKMNKEPEDALIDILIDERVRTGAIFFSMSEDNLRRFLALPYTMIGTDSSARSFSGPTCTGKPHPRGFGSFPRFIGKYVRDEKLMGLSEAIRKTTYLPALTFGLENRGLLRDGFYADIVIFDYNRIIDRATFREPYLKPDGMSHVFVNGIPALQNGVAAGTLAGRILR